MVRTTRKKLGGPGASPNSLKHEYNDALNSHPPPPAELDPSGAAGYTSYSSHGGDYGSHDLGSSANSPGRGSSPHAGRAYFPAGAPGSGDYAVEDHNQHIQHLPPLSEALHSDSDGQHYSHPGTGYDTSHHADASAHASYDHSSSNFFDPQIMEAPQPPSDTGRHSSLHHSGNGNGHFNGTIMTPPPPSTHGYASSPYQAGQGSAPHIFHRASISGPVMHSHYPAPPGTPTPITHHSASGGGGGAPPQAGDMAAWGTPSGSARPHTADGMFGSQIGGIPQQWGGSMGSGPTGKWSHETCFDCMYIVSSSSFLLPPCRLSERQTTIAALEDPMLA
jgi:hypothetical protein